MATRCTTPEQFVATFHRFTDERSFFVATFNARPIGLETPFSIQLADRTPVLRGTCVVLAAWSTGENPFKRPGVQLGIQRLTPDSERIFQQLQLARGAAPPEPIIEHTASPSKAPVPVSIPSVPRPKPFQIPTISRTTARRMTEPVPVVAAPPKSPPEVKLLEVILPPEKPVAAVAPIDAVVTNDVAGDLVESTVQTRGLEERTPGSELILPANPLQDLADESIEGFVDCTLYEETATFFRTDNDDTDFGEPAAPPQPALAPARLIEEAIHGLLALQPSGETIPIVVEDPATDQPAPIVVENQVPELPPNRLTGPQVPVTGLMPPITPPIVVQTTGSQVGPLPTDPVLVMQTMPPAADPMRNFLGDEDVRTPVPAAEAFGAPPEQPRRTTRLAAVTAPRRWMVIGGASLGATVIVILAFVARSSAEDEAKPPPPQATTPTHAVEAKGTPKSEEHPAIVDTTDATEPTDPPGSPLVGEGACKLDIKTTPAGTMVSFDGRSVGTSPITIAGSCEKHKVDLAHPRYKAEQRFVTMTADQVTNLDVSLIRPTHSLRVLTSPPGAEIYIGGRRAGTSPTIVQVNGFSGIEIRVERVGFKPVSKRVYSNVPDDTLAIGLTPLPRPKK